MIIPTNCMAQLIILTLCLPPHSNLRHFHFLPHCMIVKPGAHRPARAWFLEIAFVREVSMRVCVDVCVCMCVCVSAPEAIDN